jgi:membrane protease YdiL (CAAX protease family)
VLRILAFIGCTALTVLGYLFLLSLMRGSPYDVGAVTAALFLFVILVIINRSFLHAEGRSLAVIGLDQPLLRTRQFAIAFIAGCGLVALWTVAFQLALHPGWSAAQRIDPAGALSRLAFFLFNNGGEELAYRGYLIHKIAERFGATTAILSTSALFALLHLQSGVPWLSVVTIVFTSGILFATLFLRWRSLPLAAGFHVATNFGQELLGLRPSALSIVHPLFPRAVTPSAQATAVIAAAVINFALVAAVMFQRRYEVVRQ